MSRLKCSDCGRVFREEDADCKKDYAGEFWGAPAYQDISICPFCRSDDLEEFSYPSEDCEDNPSCDFDCKNCDYAKEEK